MPAPPPRSTLARLAAGGGVALAAFGLAAFQSRFPITLGPDWLHHVPMGIGFAAALLIGWRAVPAVLFGSVAFLAVAGVPAAPAACALAGALASTGLGAVWARKGLPFQPEFDHPRDVLQFAFGAAAAVSARGVAVAACAAALGLPGPVEAGVGSAVIDWLATVIIAPAVVLWCRGERPRSVPVLRAVEAVVVAALVAAQTWMWYGGPGARPLAEPLPALAVLVVLGNWVALRFHTRGIVTLVWVITAVIAAGAAVRGSFDPVVRLADPPAEQWAALNGMGVVILLNLVVAAVARGNRLRDVERDDLVTSAQQQAARLAELNQQLSLQAREIADQAAEAQRQRDAFEATARELAYKRAWLETVLTQLPVGMMMVDAAGTIVSRNPLLDALFGLPDDFPTGPLDEFRDWPMETAEGRPIPFDDWPINRAWRDGMACDQVQLRAGVLGGAMKPVAMSAAPIRGSDGTIFGAVLAVSDLTSVRRAEERLRLLESAVVHARDAVIVLEAVPQSDRGRSVLYVNDAFTTITGYTREEAVGRSLHFLRGPNSDPATLDRLRVALDEAAPFKGELLNYRKDGSEVWVDASLVPVAGPDGRCDHFVMIQRDTTDRRRTEEALRQSEAMFRGFFESAAAGVSLTGPDGRFLSCNRAFAELVGLTVPEVIGRHPRDVTHPDDWADQQPLVRDLVAGRRNSYQIQKRYVRPDGPEVWTELSVTAVRDSAGELVYGLGVSVDVTGRRKLEEQLRQVQKMEALGQLAGGVAHDFNNLLTAVLGNLALVRLGPDDPNRPMLRTVEQAAARAADLTRKLLGYARRNQLLVAPVAPADVIGEVVDILHRTFDPRIEINVFVATGSAILADATLVNQALINLCLNARDAMPDGGTLTLASDDVEIGPAEAADLPDGRPGAFVRFTVTDTGAGMTDAVVRRLFEPFFTTKEVGRGTGLGLPMVHGIMRQHGGWVTVASAPGRGSRFELFLPAAGEPGPEVGPTPPPRLAAPGPGSGHSGTGPDRTTDEPTAGTILLVDDESMIRQLGRVVLEAAGYEVLEAEDGAVAVDVFRRHRDRIDLVILDLTMPRLSGRDAFRQMLAIDPAARVLFSSGYSVDDLAELEGGRGLLSKPYRPPDLLAAVRQAVADPVESVAAPAPV